MRTWVVAATLALAGNVGIGGGWGAAGAQGFDLPRGLSVTNQLEYSWAKTNEEPTLENWTDLSYVNGAFRAGFRMVAFQPPDTAVTGGITPSHFDLDHRFVELSSDHGEIRAGNYYALFGHGLALNAYEERDVRVDTNLEGLRVTGDEYGFRLGLLSGTTVFGTSEDEDRARGDRLHGADLERSFESIGFTVGGSAVRLQTDGSPPKNLRAGRGTLDFYALFDRLGIGEWAYLHTEAEFAGVDRPGRPGSGVYWSVNGGLGPFDLLYEHKDYDELALLNQGAVPYNLPPALVRQHTYTLLNRHPHQLDADDEKGWQFEGTLTFWGQQLTGHYAETRNRSERVLTNYFDEIYGELDLELESLGVSGFTLINAFDYQKSFVAPRIRPEDEPFRELRTNIHELRGVIDDTNSFRVQFEHQHDQSDVEGEFDTYLTLLEWSRAPNLTFNVVGETSNRSDEQRPPGQEIDGLYGVVSYHVSDNHDVSVLYGRRLAGFICIGGVCREEPEFEGVEVRLLSRF